MLELLTCFVSWKINPLNEKNTQLRASRSVYFYLLAFQLKKFLKKWKKVVGGDEAAFEYRWGSRAEKELTKRQVLQFVSELYDTEMDSWTTQMKEILAEEEEAMNGVE